MVYTNFFKENFILIIIAAVLVLLLIFLLFFTKRKNKKPQYKIDGEFVVQLINNFGDNQNIKSINIENNRLKVEVYDLKLCNLPEIKKMSNSGIFISGNVIKALFNYQSDILKKEIEIRRKSND